MKKISLLFLATFFCATLSFSQTAVNFTVNNCNSNSTDLFSVLDAGQIIVMTWVMPCGACIPVASDAYYTSYSFNTSYPGKVLFYLVDDYANTDCSTLSDWASTNDIIPNSCFSNSAIDMTDYGSVGMQKTVVLGGTNHTVYYDVVGEINTTDLSNAITTALTTSSIFEKKQADVQLNIFPNPASENISISYTIPQFENVKMEIVNMLGEKIRNVENKNNSVGQNKFVCNIEGLKSGIYFLQFYTQSYSQQVKFIVL